jgi:hypothetical protein
MTIKQAAALLANSIDPALCSPAMLREFPESLCLHVYVVNALAEAVRNHVQEQANAAAASGQPFTPVDTADPVNVCRILFDFMGEGFGSESLELVILPEGSSTDHPLVRPGKRQKVCPNMINNAMCMMLRVPTVPRFGPNGKIVEMAFHPDYYFSDLAGMERWLQVRAERNPNNQLFMMKV